MDERLTIGDLANATGTKVVTVRYYEQAGLLPAPPRTSGNYRTYGVNHLHRLRFIRRCRDLGFTLDQVRDFLRLSAQENQPCTEVNRISAEHLTEIEQKIAGLTRLANGKAAQEILDIYDWMSRLLYLSTRRQVDKSKRRSVA